nr:MAG TPA: hypothetical protein [Inoviridae sp.]
MHFCCCGSVRHKHCCNPKVYIYTLGRLTASEKNGLKACPLLDIGTLSGYPLDCR